MLMGEDGYNVQIIPASSYGQTTSSPGTNFLSSYWMS